MQSIRLDQTGTADQVRRELERLTAGEYLTQQQAQAVNPAWVTAFFASDLGRRMKASDSLHREAPFSVLAPADHFFPNAPAGEQVLLQGVIDVWFREGEGITLVDFKTDRVTPQTAPDRAQRYQGQLAAYAYALEQVTGIPVTRRVLWFLYAGAGVELPAKKSG